jgi:hypothetical protein
METRARRGDRETARARASTRLGQRAHSSHRQYQTFTRVARKGG